jgi:putative ABC transport system permease protein
MRYGVRALAKIRGFTIVSLLTLALGIGANTAIFSFVDAVLLKPLPYEDADRIVMVMEKPMGNRNGISTLITGTVGNSAKVPGGRPQKVFLPHFSV